MIQTCDGSATAANNNANREYQNRACKPAVPRRNCFEVCSPCKRKRLTAQIINKFLYKIPIKQFGDTFGEIFLTSAFKRFPYLPSYSLEYVKVRLIYNLETCLLDLLELLVNICAFRAHKISENYAILKETQKSYKKVVQSR